MKRAVIYARYSSDTQTEQSIEGQLRVCQQYAQNNDILVLDTYIDRAMSGTNDNRPDFKRMLRDSNKKQWDYVLVYKLDRFSRDKYETTMHKHTLKTNGIKLISAMENIPDTPEGIILESLLEGMNQYYSAELSQKVLRGLKESYIKGLYTGGCQIYGYDIINKKNIINENEAEIVREIFSKYARGITGVAIAEDLAKRGIRNKSGFLFKKGAIYRMIENPKYAGKTIHRGEVYTNIYPAIIDEDTWQKVQNIRNSNKHSPGRKKEIYDFILSGKLICGYCKEKMVGNSGTSKLKNIYYYYECLSRKRRHKDCLFKPIKKQVLEDFVINTIQRLLYNEDTLSRIVACILNKHDQLCAKESCIKLLEAKKNNLVKASNNLISALEQGIITEQTKIRLKELEKEITKVEFDIELEKQRQYSFLDKEKIEKFLKSIINNDIENITVRKAIINTFVREIILYNDEIIIVFNFTENAPILKQNSDIQDNIPEVIKQSKKTAFLKNKCSDMVLSSPPQANNANTLKKELAFFNSQSSHINPSGPPQVNNANTFNESSHY